MSFSDIREYENGRSCACTCCGLGNRETKLEHVGGGHFRCEKHVGRLPCIIIGCGRTFKMANEDTYDHIIMCGRHWRMGPKRLRDRQTKLRRLAKRRGWTGQLIRMANGNWERVRKIVDDGGCLDIAEINKLMGWDE